jgi:hypothetical protein
VELVSIVRVVAVEAPSVLLVVFKLEFSVKIKFAFSSVHLVFCKMTVSAGENPL